MKQLVLVGLSHKTASVALRERASFAPDRTRRFLKEGILSHCFDEAVVLSTCNRTELYAVGDDPGIVAADLRRTLLSPREGEEDSCYECRGMEAVSHLFAVAAGLDSMVPCESEVLGQVKRAYELSRDAGATGKLTNVVFQRALFVGKLVRTRLGTRPIPSSIAQVSVALAGRLFKSLAECKVLVVGAGVIAESVAGQFSSCPVSRLIVINRSPDKARRLAGSVKGTDRPFDDLAKELESCDVAVFSTSSTTHLLSAEDVLSVMERRPRRPLFLIDLSVPRNIDPAAHRVWDGDEEIRLT
ncbi:MAG TPA: glutamyl-tRNA reductase, partial [Elusimicrobiota bacterium]|nr:glutamyl-tRNA reductase [Elusimicrobiota bacterium]